MSDLKSDVNVDEVPMPRVKALFAMEGAYFFCLVLGKTFSAFSLGPGSGFAACQILFVFSLAAQLLLVHSYVYVGALFLLMLNFSLSFDLLNFLLLNEMALLPFANIVQFTIDLIATFLGFTVSFYVLINKGLDGEIYALGKQNRLLVTFSRAFSALAFIVLLFLLAFRQCP